jgi:hypothetical protein
MVLKNKITRVGNVTISRVPAYQVQRHEFKTPVPPPPKKKTNQWKLFKNQLSNIQGVIKWCMYFFLPPLLGFWILRTMIR